MLCDLHRRNGCTELSCRIERIEVAITQGIPILLQTITEQLDRIERKEGALMTAFSDLKTEVESFIADVKTDVDALGAKIATLQAAVDSGASAAEIASLTSEVTAAHGTLSGTVAAPPVVAPPAEPTA
jgi:predicted  nucleic acid-binding Zn-ribbon protein